MRAIREGTPKRVEVRELVFSGTSCTGGEATAVVFNTGMHSELGRIAALSQRVGHDESPLEKQVKHVARLIAVVAVGMGVAFIPLGTLMAGLSLGDAVNFAIGLLVANVPEGLLPTITLALAVGVRILARRGVLVKRISAVETLGSTSVICTDKTGTLTLNRMRVTRGWTSEQILDFSASLADIEPGSAANRMARAVVACNNAELDPTQPEQEHGDATELALLHVHTKGTPEEGLRLLAVAERDVDQSELPDLTREQAEHDLTLLGGGVDDRPAPPRPEVADAVARWRSGENAPPRWWSYPRYRACSALPHLIYGRCC